MKITSEDIARIANVSRSTVSRVINNYPNVPESTREKVMKVIKEYNYIPNSSARSLAGKANNIIGLFIADVKDSEFVDKKWLGIESPYFLKLTTEVIAQSKKLGNKVLINIITNKKEYDEIEPLYLNGTISAGIFVGFEYNNKKIRELINKNYKMALVDQMSDPPKTNNVILVNSQNFEGGYEATTYLINKGHTKIAHLKGDKRLSSIERFNGYKKAMDDNNLNIKPSYILEGKYSELYSYNQVKNLLKEESITAIFAANDLMALGALKAITELGLRVPEDISILGFDNLYLCDFTEPPLTTLEISIEEIAQKAVRGLLDNKIENNVFKCFPRIIERKSVSNKTY